MSSHAISSPRTTGDPGERILRYTLVERIHHWMGALFYVYCLITGLAFWSPYMYWLAAHCRRRADGALLASLVWPGFTSPCFGCTRCGDGDMATTDADRRWHKAVKHYIENEDQIFRPRAASTTARRCFSG